MHTQLCMQNKFILHNGTLTLLFEMLWEFQLLKNIKKINFFLEKLLGHLHHKVRKRGEKVAYQCVKHYSRGKIKTSFTIDHLSGEKKNERHNMCRPILFSLTFSRLLQQFTCNYTHLFFYFFCLVLMPLHDTSCVRAIKKKIIAQYMMCRGSVSMLSWYIICWLVQKLVGFQFWFWFSF